MFFKSQSPFFGKFQPIRFLAKQPGNLIGLRAGWQSIPPFYFLSKMTLKEDLKKFVLTLPLMFLMYVFVQYDSTSNSGIRKHVWKYANGANMGDFLLFRHSNVAYNYALNDDTLFYQGVLKGIIVKRGWRLWGDNYLLIKSLETGQTGRYCDK